MDVQPNTTTRVPRTVTRKKKAKKPRIARVTEVLEINRSLTHNLTGGQIQDILDNVIYESLTPLVRTSDIFDIQVVYLLGLTAKNKKRKLSALPRTEFINNMCKCLMTENRERKIEILKQSKIERGFVYNFVVKFLKATEDYVPLYQKYLFAKGLDKLTLDLKLSAIESNVGSDRDKLFSAINVATDYLELTSEFKNSVVSNYIKLAYKQARAFCSMKGPNFHFEDVYQNFLTAITKAVDKYDCSKGALTSYINWWVLNAQNGSNTDHGHEYGIAYSIPPLQRKQMAQGNRADVNFSVSLNQIVSSNGEDVTELKDYLVGDSGVDIEIEQRQEMDVVRYLAKCADIRGLARLYLDLDEVFSPKELRTMKEIMRKQMTLSPTPN